MSYMYMTSKLFQMWRYCFCKW